MNPGTAIARAGGFLVDPYILGGLGVVLIISVAVILIINDA